MLSQLNMLQKIHRYN